MASAIGYGEAREPELELASCPRPASVPRLQPSNQAVFLASALFAAGVTCFVALDRPGVEPSPEPAPAQPPAPAPAQAAPAAAAAGDTPALLPLTLDPVADAGGSLVPFSLLETLRPEALPLLGALPKGKAAAMLLPLQGPKADRQDAEPMVEPSGAAPFNDLRLASLAGGVRREADPAVAGHAARMAAATKAWWDRRRAQLGLPAAAPQYDPGHDVWMTVRCSDMPADAQGRREGGRGGRCMMMMNRAAFGAKAAAAEYRPDVRYAELVARDPGAKVMHAASPNGGNTVTEMSDGSLYATNSPLVFDLSGAGVRTSDRMIRFDVDGRGRIQRIHDIASGCALLVFDADRDGIAGEHARELFGDRTDLDGDGAGDGYADGFEALAALVRRAEKDKVLPVGSAEFGRLLPGDLAALHKAYGLGFRVGGVLHKTVSPAKAGVAEIALSGLRSVRTENFDGQGNDVVRRDGAVFVKADGSTGAYEDIFFRFLPARLLDVAFARE